MIIKAGTYRFNEVISVPPSTDTIPITFTNHFNFNIEGMFADVINTYSSLKYDASYNQLQGFLVSYVGETNITIETNRYTSLYLYNDEAWDIDRTFNVTADTEVDDDNGTWFTENTQMLIKAGTYRWNDFVERPSFDLTIFGTFVSLPIVCEPVTIVDGDETYTFSNFKGLTVYGDSNLFGFTYVETLSDIALPIFSSFAVNDGWGSLNSEVSSSFPVAYGQIITVTEDTYVPTEYGLWAVANWQPYTEPTPTDNTTITIIYKGSPIITITNGVMLNADGEPVTKAIIPTESYKLDSNIELTITNS